ncbi:tryptophan synthase subunit alpha [Salsipaludibacter albus]|uniref:tryptophan synthase subunit alpha n=1 Tax=Salsipaludibacter albus TaxID=2849650 RepID=UPI001EE41342|nr:tryptophan synthase subunit alpha [Salsipaludibacter albus]MBY5163176.1 tryptophan synthase subunit alpha [Salsipaludibacter albus]
MADEPIRIVTEDLRDAIADGEVAPSAVDETDDIPPERVVDPADVAAERPDGAGRVAHAFAAARAQDRAALVIYLPAGFPDHDTSRACLAAAAEAGADVLEVGFPFSDPVMDGPIIQAANQQVLERGVTVADHLAMCTVLTDEVDVPALVMTYVTIADAHGYGRFADELAAAGIAGTILPDLPVDESGPWDDVAAGAGLASVLMASSVSSDRRLDAIAGSSTGFIYATGLLGVTGVKSVARRASEDLVDRLRTRTDTPIAVGVGVKDAQDARAVAGFADGVIVGSEVVAVVADGAPAGAPDRVAALVAELRRGVEQG